MCGKGVLTESVLVSYCHWVWVVEGVLVSVLTGCIDKVY